MSVVGTVSAGFVAATVSLFTLGRGRTRRVHPDPRAHRPVRVAVGAATVVTLLLAGAGTARAAIVPTVDLATSATYSVLAGTTIVNTGPSSLGQNAGVSPDAAVVGFPPGQVLGVVDAGNATALQAQADLTIAYVDAANRPVDATTSGELGGLTLVGGVYNGPSNSPLQLTGPLVLDGQGDPNSVFIFQTGSTLTTASSSTVSLINGAQECNVFWQVGSSATLGTGSVFTGNILALTSISVNTGVTVHGRALARNGAVTLDNDVFTAPTCDLTPIPPTTVATTAPASTVAPTTAAATTSPTTLAPGTDSTLVGLPTLAPGITTIGPDNTFATNTTPTRRLPATGGGDRMLPITAAALMATGLLAVAISRRRPSDV